MEMQSTNHSSLGIHCLGNGRLCAYEQGPNILQVFGPPYSSPMLGSLMLDADASVRAESRREPGAAIWTHQLFAGDAPFAELTDFVDADFVLIFSKIAKHEVIIAHNWSSYVFFGYKKEPKCSEDHRTRAQRV